MTAAAIYYLDDFTCGTDKFQDGAVVANNPGVIALQEARALWPDTPIEVLVSVGTGSTPKSRRDKGLSAFMDTGNILIESATSVERVHEALATMTPLMPNMKYYRFEPVDERCGMELDEINPEKWLSLEIATQEYVEANAAKFNAAALSLGGGLGARVAAQAETDTQSSVARLTLGLRRSLLVILSQSPAPEPAALEVAAVLCSRLASCSAVVDMSMNATQVDTLNGSPLHASPRSRRNGSGRTDQQQHMASPVSHAVSMTAPTVPSSHVATLPAPNVVEVDLAGTLGSMLRWFSPSKESETQDSSFLANSKLVTPDPRPTALLNADADTRDPEDIIASSGDNYHISSPASQQPFHDAALSPTISSSQQDSRVLVEDEIGRLEHSIMDAVPAVGVIHLGLQSCSEGPVLRWQETYSAVTVPSTEADALVRMAGAIGCLEDLGNIQVESVTGSKIPLFELATISLGTMERYGSVTADGQSEVVQGLVIGLRGANARDVVADVRTKLSSACNKAAANGVVPPVGNTSRARRASSTLCDGGNNVSHCVPRNASKAT